MAQNAIGVIKIEGSTGGFKINDFRFCTPMGYNAVLAPKQAQNARGVKATCDFIAKTEGNEQPQNEHRSIRPDVLVVLGVCTHLGCAPSKAFDKGRASGLGEDWVGGFFCPCHGSTFDFSGRVYKNVPAPTNLVVPPHSYISENRIVIGVDETEATA